MSITSLAAVRAGLQPSVSFVKSVGNNGNSSADSKSSMWAFSGLPAAGAYDTTLNGVTLTYPVTGALPFVDPPGGQNCYLARFQGMLPTNTNSNPNGGTVILCDRLWHNGGIDITGASSPQAITSPMWPARDLNQSTNGVGIYLAAELSTAPGNGQTGPSTFTVGYTNSSGVSGRTATFLGQSNSLVLPSNLTAFSGWTCRFDLQSGDLGVQSVQSVSIGTGYTAGTINLVAYRPITILPTNFYRSNAIDAVTAGMPQIFNDSVLYFMIVYQSLTSGNFSGELDFTFG